MIEQKIEELGYSLPDPATPSFIYVPVKVHNDTAYVSGQLPKVDGEIRVTGKVGDQVSLEVAQEQARICILQGLSCIKQEIGSLDKIQNILKVTGFVSSSAGFNAQPKVIDAASELLVSIFGEQGKHARAAVGVNELPRNTPVEIEMIVTVND